MKTIFDDMIPGTKFYAIDQHGNGLLDYWFAGFNPKAESSIIGICGYSVEKFKSIHPHDGTIFTTDYEEAKKAFIIMTEKRLQTIKEIYSLK